MFFVVLDYPVEHLNTIIHMFAFLEVDLDQTVKQQPHLL